MHKFIYNSATNHLIIILSNGQVINRYDVDSISYKIYKDIEEKDLMAIFSKPEDIVKTEKVDKSKWSKFIEQEYVKISKDFKKRPSQYCIYEDEQGITKLALESFTKTKYFTSKNNNIIGNLEVLYYEIQAEIVKERVVSV